MFTKPHSAAPEISVALLSHTHVGHRNSKRSRDREINESLLTLGRGSRIIFYEPELIR